MARQALHPHERRGADSILTGWHWLHLDIGLTVLAILTRRARKPQPSKNDWIIIEEGAWSWPMIDFLWILIFPLLYLVR